MSWHGALIHHLKQAGGAIQALARGVCQRLGWIGLVCGVLLAPVASVFPQEETTYQQHAGIVVQFGDGRIETACVMWENELFLTAEELLRRSGLEVQIGAFDYGGSAVCKIEAEGCNIDQGENCYCQYDANAATSRLWLAYQLKDAVWQRPGGPPDVYLSRRIVYDGAVEAWVWGYPGGVDGRDATQPSQVIPFEQICDIATPTPTGTATSTVTPTGTATGTATPTATRRPRRNPPDDTATPTPTLTATVEPTAVLRAAASGATYLPLIMHGDASAVAPAANPTRLPKTTSTPPARAVAVDPTQPDAPDALAAATTTPDPIETVTPLAPTATPAPSPSATPAPTPTLPPPTPTPSPAATLEPTSLPLLPADRLDESPFIVPEGMELPTMDLPDVTATPTVLQQVAAAVPPDVPAAADAPSSLDYVRDPDAQPLWSDPVPMIAIWGGLFVVMFIGLIVALYLQQRHPRLPAAPAMGIDAEERFDDH